MSDTGSPLRLLHRIGRPDATVLVVDERDDTRTLALTFFASLGCRVAVAEDLRRAAALLRLLAVDLVVACYDDDRARPAAETLRACAGEVPILTLAAGKDSLRELLAALGNAVDRAVTAAPN